MFILYGNPESNTYISSLLYYHTHDTIGYLPGYKIIHIVTFGKILIVSYSEYEFIYTIFKNKPKGENEKINMYYDRYTILGIDSLCRIFFKEDIRSILDVCYMIDNYISNYNMMLRLLLVNKDKYNDILYGLTIAKQYTNIEFTKKILQLIYYKVSIILIRQIR